MPRFLGDATVGKLVRKLRALGLDVAWLKTTQKSVLKALALRENRILLTRKKALQDLSQEGVQVHLLLTELPWQQVREILRVYRPEIRPFHRCIECNTPLEPVAREEARGKVPYYTWRTHETFYRCPTCGRYYWHGTHLEAMERQFREALGDLYHSPQKPKEGGKE